MSELRVRMDPLNPGQFFACCGLLTLIDLHEPEAPARFELDPAGPRVAEFVVECSVPLAEVLSRLKTAQPGFPDDGIEAAIRPAAIPYDGRWIALDWWLDEFGDKTLSLKCWAGQVTTRNLFSDLLPMIDESSSGANLFERARMSKSKFGVDPRSAWNALDFGFSPNEHAADAATFPAVEILAAIGLQEFRPDAVRRDRVPYSLWREWLPVVVARQAFRAPWAGLPHRKFVFSIAMRGQSYKYFTFAVDSGKESTDQ